MIRLFRDDPPATLLKNQPAWTKRWQRIRKTGTRNRDWATRTAKAVIRDALVRMTFGKCAFCEALLGVTSDPEIEHYHPKTVREDLAFEWANLLPVCRLCNRAKGDWNHQGSLLKPDEEDPEPFFWIHPDTGKLAPHPALNDQEKRRAEQTIRLCDLQRSALCSQRIQTIERAGKFVDSLSRIRTRPSASRRAQLPRALIREWKGLSDPRAEYKFVLRHLLERRGLGELARQDRDRFERRLI